MKTDELITELRSSQTDLARFVEAVVRDSISARYPEWNTELETFEGNTAELLRYCMTVWWERVGATKASGITKLMMSEAGNFPELSAFYRQEFIEPGHLLIQRILQRGMDRGEFRPVDMTQGIYLVLAPMLFLATWQHALGVCGPAGAPLDPAAYLQAQVDNILNGLCVRPGGALL